MTCVPAVVLVDIDWRKAGGDLVELVLRLDQVVVAQLDQPGEFARAEHVLLDQIDLEAGRGRHGELADAGLGIVGVEQRVGESVPALSKSKMRGPAVEDADARAGHQRDGVVVAVADAQVHLLAQRADEAVALVEQRGARAGVDALVGEAVVDLFQRLQLVVDVVDAGRDLALDLLAQRLDVAGQAVERAGQLLRLLHGVGAVGEVVGAGGQRGRATSGTR